MAAAILLLASGLRAQEVYLVRTFASEDNLQQGRSEYLAHVPLDRIAGPWSPASDFSAPDDGMLSCVAFELNDSLYVSLANWRLGFRYAYAERQGDLLFFAARKSRGRGTGRCYMYDLGSRQLSMLNDGERLIRVLEGYPDLVDRYVKAGRPESGNAVLFFLREYLQRERAVDR